MVPLCYLIITDANKFVFSLLVAIAIAGSILVASVIFSYKRACLFQHLAKIGQPTLLEILSGSPYLSDRLFTRIKISEPVPLTAFIISVVVV